MKAMTHALHQTPNTQSTQSTFNQLLMTAIQAPNQAAQVSDQLKADFAKGEPISMSELMVADQKSKVAMQMLIQFRKQFINAYKEVMNGM